MRTPLILLAAASLAGGSVASASGGGGGGANFVPLEPISVPIVDGGRTQGTLRVKLVLAMADEAAAAGATATLPKLRAASVATVLEFARLYASPHAPVDAGRLAAELKKTLHGADAGVRRVLIVEVVAVRG